MANQDDFLNENINRLMQDKSEWIMDRVLAQKQGEDSLLNQALVKENGYTSSVSGGINALLGNKTTMNFGYTYADSNYPDDCDGGVTTPTVSTLCGAQLTNAPENVAPPWPKSQPAVSTNSASSPVSIPSATTVRSSSLAIRTVELTIACFCESSQIPVKKDRSSFSSVNGRRLNCSSDEKPVPKSSSSRRKPASDIFLSIFSARASTSEKNVVSRTSMMKN